MLRDRADAVSRDRREEIPHPDETQSVFARLVGLSRFKAWEIVGGLSTPSKMPCYAWGIPAETCQVGAELVDVEGSVCASCYALKGRYRMPNVQNANWRRLERAADPDWIPAMVQLVYWQAMETGEAYFRWFDTGDLQSVEILRSIAAVAAQTPEIRHWLPTRERAMVEKFLEVETLPPNLVIRLSARMVDERAPEFSSDLPTSTVHSAPELADGFRCRANERTPATCGGCRACWSARIKRVSYPLH